MIIRPPNRQVALAFLLGPAWAGPSATLVGLSVTACTAVYISATARLADHLFRQLLCHVSGPSPTLPFSRPSAPARPHRAPGSRPHRAPGSRPHRAPGSRPHRAPGSRPRGPRLHPRMSVLAALTDSGGKRPRVSPSRGFKTFVPPKLTQGPPTGSFSNQPVTLTRRFRPNRKGPAGRGHISRHSTRAYVSPPPVHKHAGLDATQSALALGLRDIMSPAVAPACPPPETS